VDDSREPRVPREPPLSREPRVRPDQLRQPPTAHLGDAPPGDGGPQEQELAGVVVDGVEHGSVVLRDDDGGQWQLGRAHSALVGRRVRLRGRVRPDVMTTAQQGVPVEVLEVLGSDDGPSEPPPGPRGSDPRL
jgi:hypothetical protein